MLLFLCLCVCYLHVVTVFVCVCIIKKAEQQRIDAFELWCWRRLLRVPWTGRRSKGNESNPKGNES